MVITTVLYSLYGKFSSAILISVRGHLDSSVAKEQLERCRLNPELIQEQHDWLLYVLEYIVAIVLPKDWGRGSGTVLAANLIAAIVIAAIQMVGGFLFRQ